MEEFLHLATATDPLLTCCLCKRLIREAVQLACLHNCCRQCFSTATLQSSNQRISCCSCDTITSAGTEQRNCFVESQVQRYTAIAESRACGICRENGEYDKPALMWCPSCRHSLCEDCIAPHRQCYKSHITQSLDELQSLDEVCTQPSASVCSIHKKPLSVACQNCERAKCISCWAKCKESKHEMHIVGEDSFNRYVAKFVACIATKENDLFRKSAVLESQKSVLQEIKAKRDRHLDDLNQRKRRILDTIEIVYQEIEVSTKNAYDDLEADGEAAAAAADRIASDLLNAQRYIRRLVESNDQCEILNQQKMVRERLSALSDELDTLSDRLGTTVKEVTIDASLPVDLENVVRAWIGVPLLVSSASSSRPQPQMHQKVQQQQQEIASSSLTSRQQQQQQQQQQHQEFCFSTDAIHLPVNCWDVALTKDGLLLLAAAEHGLIELCSSGCELSRWRPPEQCNGNVECVPAVAGLSDGRAAVSLHCAQLVVLLRRCLGDGSLGRPAAGGAWTEDCRLDQLPWPSRCLSTHGDVLAVTECRLEEQLDRWLYGHRLQLMSVSSRRRRLKELQREYSIRCLAVTVQEVITGSFVLEELSGGDETCVLDAHSLEDGADERLWRHELSRGDLLRGVCADSNGGCLYAAVFRRGGSSGRVSALSLADGSELRRVVLSFDPVVAPHPQLLPMMLSLSGGETSEQQLNSANRSCGARREQLLLVVLCWDSATNDWMTVTVNRSACERMNDRSEIFAATERERGDTF